MDPASSKFDKYKLYCNSSMSIPVRMYFGTFIEIALYEFIWQIFFYNILNQCFVQLIQRHVKNSHIS